MPSQPCDQLSSRDFRPQPHPHSRHQRSAGRYPARDRSRYRPRIDRGAAWPLGLGQEFAHGSAFGARTRHGWQPAGCRCRLRDHGRGCAGACAARPDRDRPAGLSLAADDDCARKRCHADGTGGRKRCASPREGRTRSGRARAPARSLSAAIVGGRTAARGHRTRDRTAPRPDLCRRTDRQSRRRNRARDRRIAVYTARRNGRDTARHHA